MDSMELPSSSLLLVTFGKTCDAESLIKGGEGEEGAGGGGRGEGILKEWKKPFLCRIYYMAFFDIA